MQITCPRQNSARTSLNLHHGVGVAILESLANLTDYMPYSLRHYAGVYVYIQSMYTIVGDVFCGSCG